MKTVKKILIKNHSTITAMEDFATKFGQWLADNWAPILTETGSYSWCKTEDLITAIPVEELEQFTTIELLEKFNNEEIL